MLGQCMATKTLSFDLEGKSELEEWCPHSPHLQGCLETQWWSEACHLWNGCLSGGWQLYPSSRKLTLITSARYSQIIMSAGYLPSAQVVPLSGWPLFYAILTLHNLWHDSRTGSKMPKIIVFVSYLIFIGMTMFQTFSHDYLKWNSMTFVNFTLS